MNYNQVKIYRSLIVVAVSPYTEGGRLLFVEDDGDEKSHLTLSERKRKEEEEEEEEEN